MNRAAQLVADLLTPLLVPLVFGVWPAWVRRIPHTLFVWGVLAVPLVLWGQDGRSAWAQQMERRVESLEDWRESSRDLLAQQTIINAQNREAIQRLGDLAEKQDRRLTDNETQLRIIVNTGETMIRVGWYALVGVPILFAIVNGTFNYFMFRRQLNGKAPTASAPKH